VAKYSVQPSAITDTAKVTGTIPKGKSVYFIPCGPNPECQQEGAIVKQAANILGWSTVIVPNDGTPQGDKAAFDQVVRGKPVAVLYTAIPQAVFQSEVPALKANGTAVIACCVTDPTGNGVDYNIDSPSEAGIVGQAQAAITANASKCQNSDAVIVNIPDFAILADGVANYKHWMSVYCPSATVSELDVALANLATANTTIVSYARAHPNIHYVAASTDGITVGLPAALTAAGLSGVHIVGQGATPTNIQYLHANQEVGDAAFPYYEAMWAMMTAAAQHAAGEPITPAVAPPLWVLTPSNAPNTSAAAFPVVPNYAQQYKALWGVS
jgi:ribose transport system substrate-binding protein